MNLLILKVMHFDKGSDELAGTKKDQAAEPAFYDDGTAEIRVDLARGESAYVRINIGELVRLRAEAAEVEEAPEAG